MTPENPQSKTHDLPSDIIFIDLPPSFTNEGRPFPFDLSKPLPVQIAEGETGIDPIEGIRIEAIAAAIIRLLAYHADHPDLPYYRNLLLAMQPDVGKELQLAAIAKAKAGDYAFAEELFLAVAHLDPTRAESFVNAAVLYGEQAQKAKQDKHGDDFDHFATKQLEILSEGLGHNPLSEVLLAEIGLLHLFLGNEDQALEHLRSYLRIASPSDKRDLIERQVKELSEKIDDDTTLYAAFDEMQMGNEQQALHLIETFIDHRGTAWEGHFIKGWALRVAGRFEDAAASFVRCLELGEKNADIYNELSVCMSAQGHDELAKDYLDIALELEPENVKLLTNLAYLCLKEEQYNQVHELLLRAQAIDEDDPMVKHLQQELAKRNGEEDSDDVIDG